MDLSAKIERIALVLGRIDPAEQTEAALLELLSDQRAQLLEIAERVEAVEQAATWRGRYWNEPLDEWLVRALESLCLQ